MTTMPLPAFEYLAPDSLEEAARLLADDGRTVMLVGGGTDLFPKMKRRQVMPSTLVSLSAISGMDEIRIDEEGRCVIGASTLVRDVAASDLVPPVLAAAAAEVASPQIRNTATVGGNLCVDTRCNYIDMSDLWRQASGYCLKDGGEVCWVAPASNRCWAVSSSDLVPVAVALRGLVRLVSVRGERVVPAEDLYQNDGIIYQTKAQDEILVELVVPPLGGRASYRKLRRRGSIDFPILSVAAAATFDEAGACLDARVVLGSVAPAPLRAHAAEEYLVGRRLTADVIEEAAELAGRPSRPQNNTDLGSRYRKRMTSVFVSRALGDLVSEREDQ